MQYCFENLFVQPLPSLFNLDLDPIASFFWLRWVLGERGLIFAAVCGLLIVVASLVAEHGL